MVSRPVGGPVLDTCVFVRQLVSLRSYRWTIQSYPQTIYIPSGVAHAVINLGNSAIISPSYLHPCELPNWLDFMLSPAARALIYTNSDFTITSLERLRELIAKRMEADGRMKNALQNPVGVFPSHKQNMDQEALRLEALPYVTDPVKFISDKFSEIINQLREFRK